MKKSPEQIKQDILKTLEQGPLSIQQISKGIESNWLTIDKFVKGLVELAKVREIMLPNKTKVYRLIREDTYLDIPITKEEREIFYFLFDNARKAFKELGRENPAKIQMQKTIVNVIDKFNLKVPTVWYLYGKMTLMKYETEKDYSQYSIRLEQQEQILQYMKEVIYTVIKTHWTRAICKAQYCAYDQSLYLKKENIYEILVKERDLNKKKDELRKNLIEMYFSFPSTAESSTVNNILHEFEILVGKMTFLPDLNKHRKALLEAFDAVWKMIAIYMFYESLTSYYRFKNKLEVKSVYLEDSINTKISIAQELISDLQLEYINGLEEMKEPPMLPDTPETRLMSELISEMAEEGVIEDEPVS